MRIAQYFRYISAVELMQALTSLALWPHSAQEWLRAEKEKWSDAAHLGPISMIVIPGPRNSQSAAKSPFAKKHQKWDGKESGQQQRSLQLREIAFSLGDTQRGM